MAEPDPRGELRDLVRSTRAWLEALRESGAEGAPSERPAAELGRLLARSVAARAAPPAKSEKAAVVHDAPEVTAAAVLPPEERRARLAVVEAEVRGCTRCALHAGRTQTVFARGNPAAELMFVGEGPGADEDAQGLPFVGKAGQLLDRMIVAMGYRPEDVYVGNIVKCRPPGNRKPAEEEMAACVPYLHEQIALVSPRVIVALGATAVQGLLGTTMGITQLRGRWRLYRGRTPVMPTFHPAYLLRSPEKKREVWQDLQDVMRKLGKEPPPKPQA
jgi:DNA polymerase